MKKEKEENISRRKTYLFVEKKENGERKGGKYLEKENIFFCRGEGKEGHYFFGGGEGKGWKCLKKENIFFCSGEGK